MTSSFGRAMSKELELELNVVTKLCAEIDTPRALTVKLLLENREYEQYLDLSIDPSLYQDVSNFADDYLVTEILRKSKELPLDVDRYKVAKDSFYEAEAQCKETNERFQSTVFCAENHTLLNRVRVNVRKVLGKLSSHKLSKIIELCDHGKGATTGVMGHGSVKSDKYDGEIHLTDELRPFHRAIMGERWYKYNGKPRIVVEGNKFTTVPKDARKDRGICVEPTLNLYLQKGIGKYLRGALRHQGIDLDHQDRNQHMAEAAYRDDLSTLDLSSASDTVSKGLVAWILPDDWHQLLDLARSKVTLVEGVPVPLEKFSSMGNGFTFELESLIFWAICKSVIPCQMHQSISVYGDDLIVPRAFAPDVIDALNTLGFSVNGRKSFLAGSFFESCGTDWFKGQNVRPIFLKYDRESKIPQCIQVANAIRIYANRRGCGEFCDLRFREAWLYAVKRAPKLWRKCKIPATLGDAGLITSRSEAGHLPKATRAGFSSGEGWMVKHVKMTAVQRRKTEYSRLLHALKTTGSSALSHDASLLRPIEEPIFTKGREPVRGFLGRPRLGTVQVGFWTEGFDWR